MFEFFLSWALATSWSCDSCEINVQMALNYSPKVLIQPRQLPRLQQQLCILQAWCVVF